MMKMMSWEELIQLYDEDDVMEELILLYDEGDVMPWRS